MTLTGRVDAVSQAIGIPTKDGRTFTKRTLRLDCTRFDPYTGERGRANIHAIEFIGERVAELDKVNLGDIAAVSVDLYSRDYTGEQGEIRTSTTISGYAVEVKRPAKVSQDDGPASPALPSQPQSMPQAVPGFTPAPQYQQPAKPKTDTDPLPF
jgi:single-stranded DNA-binding protein